MKRDQSSRELITEINSFAAMCISRRVDDTSDTSVCFWEVCSVQLSIVCGYGVSLSLSEVLNLLLPWFNNSRPRARISVTTAADIAAVVVVVVVVPVVVVVATIVGG